MGYASEDLLNKFLANLNIEMPHCLDIKRFSLFVKNTVEQHEDYLNVEIQMLNMFQQRKFNEKQIAYWLGLYEFGRIMFC